MTDPEEFSEIISEVRAWVEMERNFGADAIRVVPTEPAPLSEPAPGAVTVPVPARVSAASSAELDAYRREIESCQNCPLGATRTKFVFGTGSSNARLMFVGEAPGADEDIQGEPFVGAAGKLLTKMIVAMGLSRNEVYIANILKCRPPGNRTPTIDEMVLCLPYILRQIEIIKPEIICALGATALKGLLRDPGIAITKLRGRFMDWNGYKLMPTFHPAYLLRSPSQKRFVWEDLQLIMRELGLSMPQSAP